MSSQTPDFSKGASGPASVYDNTPSGLGISPAYLAGGSTASASAQATLTSSIVTGIIPSTGNTATAGTGFTYTHTNGTGVYVFTYTTAFSALPTVIATDAMPGSSTATLIIDAQSASGFTLKSFNSATGANLDQAFNFIVLPTV